jgi:hypothetical protein
MKSKPQKARKRKPQVREKRRQGKLAKQHRKRKDKR